MAETKSPAPSNNKDVEDNQVVAAIGYLGILCFVPLLLAKDSKFAQFHGKQGLALFIVEIGVGVVSIIPFLGWFLGFLGFLGCAGLAIYGIVQAMQGNMTKLPVVSTISEKLNI